MQRNVEPFGTYCSVLTSSSLKQSCTPLAGLVNQYIDAHAGTHNLFDLGKNGSNVKVRSSTVVSAW